VRAGDRDRAEATRLLGEHYAAGRLTGEELAVRSAAALEAQTVAELDEIVADLPAPRPRPEPRGFVAHAALFAVFAPTLVLVWLFTRDPTPAPTDEGAGLYWPLWIVLGWALVLAVHGLRTFLRRGPEPPALPRGDS